MSWVCSVYEGPQPETVEDALERMSLAEEALDRDDPPTPTIQHFVEAILDRWPDIGDEAGKDSPWSDGPMMNNAGGSALLVGISGSRMAEVEPFLISVARRLGVVLLDSNDGDNVRVLVPSLAPSATEMSSTPSEDSRRRWFRRSG